MAPAPGQDAAPRRHDVSPCSHTFSDAVGPETIRGALSDARLTSSVLPLDLQDLENTTGSWDMYGVDEPKRYPGLQETFFKQSTDILTRREALNAFVALCKCTTRRIS